MSICRLQVRLFVEGFRAVIPLWLVAPPFALAYTAAAQKSGLNPLETQLMSLTLYSASAQIVTVQLMSEGASVLSILLTALALNIHQLLYGVSLAKRIKLSYLQRAAAAYFLTDGAYGITITTEKKASFAFLLGAELSIFLAWNVCTALALLLGQVVTIPASAHLDFAAPLTFLALLVSTARTRVEWSVAAFSTAAAVLLSSLHVGTLTVIIAGILGALMGAWWMEISRGRKR